MKKSLLDCLKSLQESGFNVRGVVSDDHSTNVNAYAELLEDYLILKGPEGPELKFRFYEQTEYEFIPPTHPIIGYESLREKS